MNSKTKTQTEKSKPKKEKETTTKQKEKDKKPKTEKKEKTVKKKKKSKKSSTTEEPQNKEIEEPQISREVLAVEKQTENVETLLENKKNLFTKLENLTKSENIATYSSPDSIAKLNKNAFFQTNLVLSKYDNALSETNEIIHTTLEQLEGSKCKKKIVI